MTDQSPASGLSDQELRETLDMVGTVLASVSDRVDAQTGAMDRLIKTATEARMAAFAAQTQTDPEHYGELIGQAMNGHILVILEHLNKASDAILRGAQQSRASFQETTEAHTKTLSLIDELHRKQQQDRRWLPWVGLGAIVLTLVLTLLLPRFLASYGPTCGVLGGVWTTTSINTDVCAFYRE